MPATIVGNSFSQSELPVVQGALQRVPNTISRMIQVLGDILPTVGRPPNPAYPTFTTLRGINRDRDRLYSCFQINASEGSANQDINVITGKFTGANSILDDSRTQITRLTPAILATINSRRSRAHANALNPAYVWGHVDNDIIYIGDAFFNPQQNDIIRDRVSHCQGRVNLDVAREGALVHEAVHILNGTGGHGSLGHLLNPENYHLFIMLTVCNNLRALISMTTDRHMARVAERPHGIIGRCGYRRPGPIV